MGNEFVMVLRETAKQAAHLLAAHSTGPSLERDTAEELRDALEKPAQHQDEPVAYFWRHNAEHEHGIARNYQELTRERPDVNSEWLSNVHEIIPLYTHADSGEVERLREGMKYESERAALCLEELQECESQRDEFYAEITGLRAKLADRDALLLEIRGQSGSSWLRGETQHKLDAALSASAEPSAPLAWHVGGNGYDRICFEKPADLPGSPCIQAIHDQRQLIDLLKRYDLRNEEAGAPVDRDEIERQFFQAGQALLIVIKSIDEPAERDERAKFESAYPGLVGRVRWDEAKQEYRSGSKGLGWQEGLKATEWLAVWQARAALERKPPVTPRDAFEAWEPTGNPIRGVNGRLAAKAGFDAGWCAGWTECRADMERKP